MKHTHEQSIPSSEQSPCPRLACERSKGLVYSSYHDKTLVSTRKHVNEKNKVRIAEGGRFLQITGKKIDSQNEYPHGTRKEIKDFSKASRGRLLRALASINQEETALPDFLTLTYPGEFSGDWREWKKNLDALNHALVRRWPSVWGVWRLEFQKRGAPHFHFLLFDGAQVEGKKVWDAARQKDRIIPDPQSEHNREVMEWISKTWYRIVKSGDPRHLAAGTRIEPIQTWEGMSYYASKYLAKLPDEGGFVPAKYEGTGRFWGKIGKTRWKVTIFEKEVGEPLFFKVKRVLRKMMEKKTGKKRRSHRDYGMSTFLDSIASFRLLTWAWGETGGDCPF